MKCIRCGREFDSDFSNEQLQQLFTTGYAKVGNVEYHKSVTGVNFICPYCHFNNEKTDQAFIDALNEKQEQGYTRGDDIKLDPLILAAARLKLSAFDDGLSSFYKAVNGFVDLFATVKLEKTSSSTVSDIAREIHSILESDSELNEIQQQLKKTEQLFRKNNPNYDLFVAAGYLNMLSDENSDGSFFGIQLSDREKAVLFHNFADRIQKHKDDYELVTKDKDAKDGVLTKKNYEDILTACNGISNAFLLSGLETGLDGTNINSNYNPNDPNRSNAAKKVIEQAENTKSILDGTTAYTEMIDEAFGIDELTQLAQSSLTSLTQETYFNNVETFQEIEDEQIAEYQKAVAAYNEATNALIDEWDSKGHNTPFTRQQYLEDQLINNAEYKELSDKVVGLSQSIQVIRAIKELNFKMAYDMYLQAGDFDKNCQSPIVEYKMEFLNKPMIIAGENGAPDIVINTQEEFSTYLDTVIAQNPDLYDEAWKETLLTSNQDYFNTKSLQAVFYDKDGNVVNNNYFKAMYINEKDLDMEEVYGAATFDINNPQYNEVADVRYKINQDIWAYLENDEKNILQYLLNTGKNDRLNDYIDYTTDLSFRRNGQAMAQEVIDKIDEKYNQIGKTVFTIGAGNEKDLQVVYDEGTAFADTCVILAGAGFKDGLKTFANGIDNLFHADGKLSADDYKTQFILSAVSERFKDKSKLSQWITTGSYELFDSIGNMAPSVLISWIPGGQGIGLGLMGASAAGNAREKGLQMGMEDGAAWMYGILNGLSEAGLQYLLGGVKGLKSANANAFANNISKVFGIPNFLADMLAEGTEESLQSILEPMFATMVTGGQIPFQVDWGEVVKSGIYGILTAGMMNGGQVIIGNAYYAITTDMIPELLAKFKGHDMTKIDEISNLTENLEELGAKELTWEDEITYNDSLDLPTKNLELKQGILNKVAGITKPEALARAIYLELNKIVHYDYTYHFGDSNIPLREIANKTLTFENLRGDRNVICMEWSALYKELLLAAGFTEEQVKIHGISHQWVTIELSDGTIIADATDNIGGGIDLENAKINSGTSGFVYVDSQYGDIRLSKRTPYELSRVIPNNDYAAWLLELDQEIGYAGKNGYLSNEAIKAKGLFGNNKLFQKIFGTNNSTTVEELLMQEKPLEMSGREAQLYYNTVFSNSNLLQDYWEVLWVQNNDGHVDSIYMQRYIDNNNETKYYVYSQEDGQKIMTNEEYESLKNSYQINKEWNSDYYD